LKIKVTPDDFVVNEIVDVRLRGSGRYRIYLLEKTGWNTLDAISSIADASGVDARLIGYAGLKDRHARTSQHISVPAERELISRRGEIRLTFLGFSDDFISTKVLLRNRFRIRMQGLTPDEIESMSQKANEIRRAGFPNYFDDQRFGSITPEGDFFAERLARGHIKGALKIHLSAVFPNQKKPERDRRAKVTEVWGKWDEVLTLCESDEDRAVAAPLTGGASKKNLLLALNTIPHEVMARYISAYQAFIWNDVLRRLMTMRGIAGTAVPGKAGPYVMVSPASEGIARDLTAVQIPTVAASLLPCRQEIKSLIEESLMDRGLKFSNFNIRGLRSRYFKSFNRNAFVIPEGLGLRAARVDTLNPKESEVVITFTLPAGSYATMLIKALATGSPRLS
jgi:tRNA pseudouridine13 synthase